MQKVLSLKDQLKSETVAYVTRVVTVGTVKVGFATISTPQLFSLCATGRTRAFLGGHHGLRQQAKQVTSGTMSTGHNHWTYIHIY